ncbi:ABC transporter ATP-binding protein [Vibrio sp. JC009]|uniref:ABC transporter ATP-binding protein n=1 Tax=Vibrio sp. JC009 TaxID=2912314 RepID=UPI0023AEA43B|nr:ABC transporter ATP-binding protein [Vibrio sp. JC009]WED23450.1 ABC transporter ATP-binding protein [Vibrio sp. JC009]
MTDKDNRPLVDVRSLSISYPGGHKALRDVSISLQRGEILGVVGESGSGKTTLIRALINLLGSGAVTENGKYEFDGVDTAALSAEQWRQLRGGRIAMIFQNPGASLSPMVSVERQFVEAIRNHKNLTKQQARLLALEEIEKLRLKDPEAILSSRPWQLSGGMKQRIAIAMSLAMNPELILADEPTSALDVTTQEVVVKELNARRKQYGTSVIMVSHNISACASIADNLLVMKNGQIVDYGSVKQVISRDEDTYSGQLVRAIPHLKATRSE